jgi:hypothetical protein
MSESDWLACQDPQVMLGWLARPVSGAIEQAGFHGVSDRRLRLFACACCRQMWHLLTDERSRRAVLVAEQYADGEAKEEDRHRMYSEARSALSAVTDQETPASLANLNAQCTVWRVAAYAATGIVETGLSRHPEYSSLLRDIVGNPFRPVTLVTAPIDTGLGVQFGGMHERCPWLTPQVVQLARAAYGERREDGTLDPLRLAVLADALEEAGCADERCQHCHGSGTYTVQVRNAALSAANGYGPATTYSEWRGCRHCGGEHDRKGSGRTSSGLLAHLRSPGPHVRGCWVVDLLLGKS